MGEFDRIARLGRVFGQGARPDGGLGVGDDAALLPGVLPVLATTDALVEGVHFLGGWLSPEALAERAIETAVSDLAAMGGAVDLPGCGLLLAWTLPSAYPEEAFDGLLRGSAQGARRHGVPIVGGNLSRGEVLTLTTTVLGRADGPVVRRDGAQVGDAVAVTGIPGLRALGLAVLRAGLVLEGLALECAEAWRRPRARVTQGRAIRSHAHAMLDLSDGLAQDAGHLARASGVCVTLDAARLPPFGRFEPLARSLGLDPVTLALVGGEDYELLAAAPRDAFGPAWTVVGTVLQGSGVDVPGGPRGPLRGWDHG